MTVASQELGEEPLRKGLMLEEEDKLQLLELLKGEVEERMELEEVH